MTRGVKYYLLRNVKEYIDTECLDADDIICTDNIEKYKYN